MASTSVAGAEMMTRGAPASMWAAAAGPSVKMPVDSITTSTPRSAHGRALGSRSAKTEKVWSPTVMDRSVWLTGHGQGAVGRVVLEEVGVGGGGDQVVDADHLDRVAAASPPRPRPAARAARRKLRPIRPNPLIPTRTAIVRSLVSPSRWLRLDAAAVTMSATGGPRPAVRDRGRCRRAGPDHPAAP